MATGGCSTQVAETIQGGAAVQQPDSVKETGSEHKEPDKGMPSGIAEQTEMNEKREEDLKQQHKRESEKMELYFKKLEKLEQDINEYKTGLTTKMSDSNDVSPPTMAETSQGGAAGQHQDSVKEMGAENEEPDKRMPSGIAEQTEMYEKRVEEFKQQCKRTCEKMELEFKKELGKLEQEINYYKSGGTRKRRDSKEFLPPAMAAVQHLPLIESFGIIIMAVFGALVGAVVGATDGVQGSAVGLIYGSIMGILLAILYIRATMFVMGSGRGAFVVEGGDQHSVRSDSSCSSKTA